LQEKWNLESWLFVDASYLLRSHNLFLRHATFFSQRSGDCGIENAEWDSKWIYLKTFVTNVLLFVLRRPFEVMHLVFLSFWWFFYFLPSLFCCRFVPFFLVSWFLLCLGIVDLLHFVLFYLAVTYALRTHIIDSFILLSRVNPSLTC
jgi:hypothetical protein